jgi:hypothetical protein
VHTVDFDSWVTITHVEGPSPRDRSVLRPQAEAPGLGMQLREDVLGDPFLDVRA